METKDNYTDFQCYLNDMKSTLLAIGERVAKIHKDVNQYYDDKPYSYHLNAVAEYVIKYLPEILEKSEDIIPVIFGAYFHDSIEDARLTYNDVLKIAKEYMSDKQAYVAAEIVYALTNEKGRNRHERANDKYYEGIRNTPYAPLVKACDRLANYNYAKKTKSKMVKCYEKEMQDFVDSIRAYSEGTNTISMVTYFPSLRTTLAKVEVDKRILIPESLIIELFNKEVPCE